MGNINVSYLGLINGSYLITLIIVSSPVHPPQHLALEQGPLCAPKTSGDGIRLEVEVGDQRRRSQRRLRSKVLTCGIKLRNSESYKAVPIRPGRRRACQLRQDDYPREDLTRNR